MTSNIMQPSFGSGIYNRKVDCLLTWYFFELYVSACYKVGRKSEQCGF